MRTSLIVAILLITSTALAADSGDIALIEDTDGSINATVGLAMNYLPKVSCAFFKDHPENFDAIFVQHRAHCVLPRAHSVCQACARSDSPPPNRHKETGSRRTPTCIV